MSGLEIGKINAAAMRWVFMSGSLITSTNGWNPLPIRRWTANLEASAAFPEAALVRIAMFSGIFVSFKGSCRYVNFRRS